MTALSVEAIHKLAHLARLELSPQEAEMLAPQFQQILSFVEQLNELDTEQVEPMTTALEVHDRFAPDVIAQGLTTEQALANAPASEGGYFLVPPVLGTAAT